MTIRRELLINFDWTLYGEVWIAVVRLVVVVDVDYKGERERGGDSKIIENFVLTNNFDI